MGLRSRQRPLREFLRDTKGETGFSNILVHTWIVFFDRASVIRGLAECTSGVSSTKSAGFRKGLKPILNFGIGKDFVLSHNGAGRMNDVPECK
jgi:hypothetical protein